MSEILKKFNLRIMLQLLILVVFTFWTIALATNNVLLLEKKIKEFCGDNILYKINGFGEIAIAKNSSSYLPIYNISGG